jgi:hypothetical protein
VHPDLIRACAGHVGALARDRVAATAGASLIDRNLTERFPLAAVGTAGRDAILRKNRLVQCQNKKKHAATYEQPQKDT